MVIRKRFHKPHRFLTKSKKLDIKCLVEVFNNFQLYDFRNELNLWQHVALSNDQNAYYAGCEREDLIDFVQELHRLIEAFHLINQENNRPKNSLSKGLSKQEKKMLLG